jgi:hypothetical protein
MWDRDTVIDHRTNVLPPEAVRVYGDGSWDAISSGETSSAAAPELR